MFHVEHPKSVGDPAACDVIVVGAGHAGCEAASATARMGLSTLLLTLSIDQIAHMSCNPAIGGVGKGQLVREIDALGGLMAKAIDATGIQFRRLNGARGPAVRSSRAQADRHLYKGWMRERLEGTDRLHIRQGMVESFLLDEGPKGRRIAGVRTQTGEEHRALAVVVAAGTFLRGLMHIGLVCSPGGREGEFPAEALSGALSGLGLTLGRLKTGTCPRLDARSIDLTGLARQEGDAEPVPFSFSTGRLERPDLPCWVTRTTAETHRVIREGLDRSPLYTGVISGVGPRYCPSIEDKVHRFPDRASHLVFLEPEGLSTREIYPNGLSTSLPVDVQLAFLRTIPGLEKVEIMRPGYAIEYDFVLPTQLSRALMVKSVPGLFLAGQINGTSGYEEAAAQGLLAGVNAARFVRGESPVTLRRDQAYIGVMVDDLVTQGTAEPYRVFTSRAEHRLLLREDNADLRLRETGFSLGLATSEEAERTREKARQAREGREELERHRVTVDLGEGFPRRGTPLLTALRQSQVVYSDLARLSPGFPPVARPDAAEQIEIEVKYEGYVRRQEALVERMTHLENRPIPADLDYAGLAALSLEIRDKLAAVRPETLGQAARVPGVTPAAVSALMVYLRGRDQSGGRG
jgi:tRNA uridine 5-carboxymethylaminomethyl modification enzyme